MLTFSVSRWCALVACVVSLAAANPPSDDLATVDVTGHVSDRDERSYRSLLRAMTVFDESAASAPGAVMRFKVFPRHDEAVMHGLTLMLLGKSVKRSIPLSADGSFVIERDAQAEQEGARVVSNRPSGSLAWRADIRTPGLPANTRRLGDLRLECKVDLAGVGADLATGIKTPSFYAIAAVSNPCMNRLVSYIWIADEPLFSVTLVSGALRTTLPCPSVYGCHASPMFDLMDWQDHLRDRVYWLPIWSTRWPDDTRVVIEPMRQVAP